MDVTQDALVEIAFDAVGVDQVAPRADLRDALLRAVPGVRPTRHPGWSELGTTTDPSRAFARTVGELRELLDALQPDEWGRPTGMPAGSVRDLVVHLAGVERYALGQLGRRPPLDAPAREDHFPVSVSATSDLRRASGEDAARAWWSEALEVCRTCGEMDPADPVTFHHLVGSVRGFLIVRTFEIWAHGEDIRGATGRGPNELDADRLGLMSAGLLEVLALGMALSGTERPGCTARIVLTGPGGTNTDVALGVGERAGAPDVTFSVRALDLCRLAARRLPISALDATVDGDRSLLEPVLVGATAFAAD